MVSGAARGTKDERRRFFLRENGDWGILAGVRWLKDILRGKAGI
jgi:hypothetical protein